MRFHYRHFSISREQFDTAMLFTLNAKFSLEHTNLNLGWNRIRVHGAMSMLSFSEKNTVIIAVNSTQHTKRKKAPNHVYKCIVQLWIIEQNLNCEGNEKRHTFPSSASLYLFIFFFAFLLSLTLAHRHFISAYVLYEFDSISKWRLCIYAPMRYSHVAPYAYDFIVNPQCLESLRLNATTFHNLHYYYVFF